MRKRSEDLLVRKEVAIESSKQTNVGKGKGAR